MDQIEGLILEIGGRTRYSWNVEVVMHVVVILVTSTYIFKN